MSIDIIFRKFFWGLEAIEFKPENRIMSVYGKQVGFLTLGVTPKNRLVPDELKSYNGVVDTVKIIIRDYSNISQAPLIDWGKMCGISENQFDHYIKQVYIETLQNKRREELMKRPKYNW
jgi:hypothetical protein